MFDVLAAKYNVDPKKTLMIGDRSVLVRERSALATLIFTSRVCLSICHSVILSVILSVRNFGAKYLGNEAR